MIHTNVRRIDKDRLKRILTEHKEWLRMIGPKGRQADLRGANLSDADLSQADLRKALLSGAYLTQANLSDADLHAAELGAADLRSAMLCRANLSEAFLVGADLRGSSLTHANLRGAMLGLTDLTAADLSGADLAEALCGYTTFAKVDLSDVKNLDQVRHTGPCIIGLDTLMRTKGPIPREFLEGCGVPYSVYESTMSAIRALDIRLSFFSAFISYNGRDEAFAKKLHDRLRDKDVQVWFAPEKLRGGKYLDDQIDKAIHAHEKLLIVISTGTLDSEWVRHEIELGHQREVRDKKEQSVLFPIRLISFEDCLKEFEKLHNPAIESKLRRYFIPDFTRWESDQAKFNEQFQNLLDALKRTEGSP